MRWRATYLPVAAAIPWLLLQPAAVARAAWSAHPWVTFSAGYEDDRLPDPTLDRFVLPGGSLLGLAPGIRLDGRLGGRVGMDLSGQVGYERFLNAADRSVLGGAVEANLRVQVDRTLVWRSTLAGNHYSDSAYETANRIGGGLETGIGIDRPGGSLELIGGIDGRRYENLIASDDAGTPDTYTETGLSIGLGGSARAGAGALISARVLRQRTEARDSLYDADSWLAQGSVRTRFALGAFLTLSVLGQQRTFRSRPASEDEDSYWQVGLGLDRAVTETMRISARYAFARVFDPLGADENLARTTVTVTWSPHRPLQVGRGSELSLPDDPVAVRVRENESRVFRCHAPEAREVSLVGDFNGWDPAAQPMRSDRDGWWQAEVRLPAGSHLYGYVVDGKTVVPADAEITVDDGFGGRCGLIWVEPLAP